MLKHMAVAAVALALAACAAAQATRTSANTMIIDAEADPECGATGASRVAARAAAIETIRAGFDRYIITGGAAQNNVGVATVGGTATTYGTRLGGGTYSATTTYTPNTIIYGTHDRMLKVVMFRKGDPGYEQALDARQALGPEWQELVKSGIRTCL
ncbi:hypothetical protein QNA08_04830 [Chelatococcus sp. SYSU_G07232]|uniref:Uncharacterized protein n=1 Tax=Chelatococcus albus TaxID=3047466 RepID=A0ABT7ADU8_9HYPH|nr:hypothetical protein [Chelatococcus sp. SYSU_G07232]MDJ1157563.1 hypothetical protein [Chelatococcus sp. SYSU_G07232]